MDTETLDTQIRKLVQQYVDAPDCALCGFQIEDDVDAVDTGRGPMHEDCADTFYDHQDARDPGIPRS
jgi:hypothetical protein